MLAQELALWTSVVKAANIRVHRIARKHDRESSP